MTFNPQNALGPFIQTSTSFPEDFKEFRIKFLELYRDIANAVNTRDNGVFPLQEFLTGQTWFTTGNPQSKRYTFRKCFEFGAIAAAGVLAIPHGLTNFTIFTTIKGTAITAVVDQRPIPYASVAAANQGIEINVGAANITISNGAAAPAITSGIVVLEYLKN